jgi:hypothetical protein
MFFWLPGTGSIVLVKGMDVEWILPFSHKGVERTEIMLVTQKSPKKGVVSVSQRYGSGDQDLDPHQNVTDPIPQHWLLGIVGTVLILSQYLKLDLLM